MKYSIGLCQAVDFDENLKMIKNAGFDGVDFPLSRTSWAERYFTKEFEDEIKEMARKIKNAGLEVTQTHLPYMGTHLPYIPYEEFEKESLELLIKGIEYTAMVGGRIAVIHLFDSSKKRFEDFPDGSNIREVINPGNEKDRQESREKNIILIEKLLPYLEKYDVVLAIENLFGLSGGEAYLSSADDILFFVNHFKSPYVKACLDTGHAKIRCQDPVDMLALEKESLACVHLHTNEGITDEHIIPHTIPKYLDKCDWNRFFEIFNGLDIVFNFELSMPSRYGVEGIRQFYQFAGLAAKTLTK